MWFHDGRTWRTTKSVCGDSGVLAVEKERASTPLTDVLACQQIIKYYIRNFYGEYKILEDVAGVHDICLHNHRGAFSL